MYEFSHKGAGFSWSALDATSKGLFTGSIAATFVALVPLHSSFKRLGAELHEYMHDVPLRQPPPDLTPAAALFAIGFFALSAWLWRRFSLRQDEMFNRVQNWSIGMAGGSLSAALGVWAILGRANLVSEMAVWSIMVLMAALYLIFWFVAVRRFGASD